MLKHFLQRALNRGQLTSRIGFFKKIDFFFRKIQRRLDQHTQVYHLLDQRMNHFGKSPRQGLRRRFRRRFGRCLDQIRYRFGLRQIELVVQKSALGKFSRLRQAQTGIFTRFQATFQQHLHHHRAAMALQFEYIFTGIRLRCLKIKRDALINEAAVRLRKWQIAGIPWFKLRCAKQGLDYRCQVLARDAHHAYAAPPRGRGDSGNGRTVVGGVLCHDEILTLKAFRAEKLCGL